MNKATSEQVKELREKHNIGIMEARRIAEMHNLKEAIKELYTSKDMKNILFKIAELINNGKY